MNRAHLSDKEISSFLIEPDSINAFTKEHLEECHICRKRLDSIHGFTKSFQEQVENRSVRQQTGKNKTLARVSGHQFSMSPLKWRFVLVASCVLIFTVFLFNQTYFQKADNRRIDEAELLKEIRIFLDSECEVEFSESIQLIAGVEDEDFNSFLNFLSPIKENDYEEDNIYDNLSIHRNNHFLFA